MPVDSRRLPVPEDSKPLCLFTGKSSGQLENLVNKSGNRRDGRTCNQTRPIFANVGVVSQARGSAYMEVGQTKVMCSVYGPREVKYKDEFSLIGQLACELKFATFSEQLRRQHREEVDEKEASLILKEALEPAVRLDKFPKSRIDVFVIVLENDGCALSTAISCASLALSNAAVEMFDLVVGSTLRQFGDIRLIDPDTVEEYISPEKCEPSIANNATMTVAFLPSLGQVSSVTQSGILNINTTKLCMKQCIEVCQQVHTVVSQCLVNVVKQTTELARPT